MDHNYYMKEALKEAHKALVIDEVPVGAVVVRDGVIIGRGHNNRISATKPTGHAEINALEAAGIALSTWNLSGCDIYITLEPCLMCMSSIIMSRINTVYFGAYEPRFGAVTSITDLSKIQNLNHYPKTQYIKDDSSSEIITNYFKNKRKIQIKTHAITDKSEMDSYFELRKQVFVEEQDVDIELEYDEYDEFPIPDEVTHVGAYQNKKLVGTMRLIRKGKDLKVGRLAVDEEYRQSGIGSILLEYAYKQGINNGFDFLILDAQVQAIKFYEKNGFNSFGEIFLDANIEHKSMKKTLKP